MTEEKNTAVSLLSILQTMSEQIGGVDATTWLQVSMKLRVLLQAEQEKLVDKERQVQEIKAKFLSDGDSATSAKIKTECTDTYVETKKLEVFIKTALDVVLLAKKFSTTESDIYHSS